MQSSASRRGKAAHGALFSHWCLNCLQPFISTAPAWLPPPGARPSTTFGTTQQSASAISAARVVIVLWCVEASTRRLAGLSTLLLFGVATGVTQSECSDTTRQKGKAHTSQGPALQAYSEVPWLFGLKINVVIFLPYKFLRMIASSSFFSSCVLLAPYCAELFEIDVHPQAVCVKAV